MTEQPTQHATLHSGFDAPTVLHHVNVTSGSCCDHWREDLREEEQSHFAGIISYELFELAWKEPMLFLGERWCVVAIHGPRLH